VFDGIIACKLTINTVYMKNIKCDSSIFQVHPCHVSV